MRFLALILVLAQPLPPLIPWSGKSRELIVPATDPWITPAEKTALRTTPNYDETVTWLRRLDVASPEIQMVSIGKSGEGRDLWMVIASRDGVFTPEALRRSGKAIVLAQAGIHSGEIDGKDAGLMLLRDMTVRGTRRALLDRANFLFVPIFNVDGHERASRFGRINQRGPEVMGWRTNASNLNLNRDYTKLDTPEVRAMVAAIHRWDPDLYIDLHVTDGADYQYDVTFGWNTTTGYSPAGTKWLEETLHPAITHDLKAWGHIPGP
jgi:murein tripeptide amidase MpaA